MFQDLLKIIEFVKNAVTGILQLETAAERKAASLKMLKTYFLILDAYEDGLRLLDSVTDDPVAYLETLSEAEVKAQLQVWDVILRRQSQRLYEAQSYISSESYLSVIDPDAQKSISKVIGYKMHEIGCQIFISD